MAGETIAVFGTVKILQATGTSTAIANLSIAQAVTASYDVVVDGLGFPDADFALQLNFAIAPTEGSVMALYAQPLNIDGTSGTEQPEATRPTMFIGSFVVNNVTTTQFMLVTARDLPKVASYYVHNNGTGQSASAGWSLKVTPRSYKAAA